MLTLVLGIWLTTGAGAVVLVIVLVVRQRRQAEDTSDVLRYGHQPQHLSERGARWRPAHREHDHHHTGQHAAACRAVAVGLVPLPLVLAGAGQ